MKTIYLNGQIITMEEEKVVEAVCIEEGRIVALGTEEALVAAYQDAMIKDLNGNTMLPAFIDAHSHFSSTANALLQVPLEEKVSVEEIQDTIKEYMEHNQIKPGEWVICKGYDHNDLPGKEHICATQLDEIAPDNPVLIQHASGHSGVVNTKAIEELQITPETKAPAGGVIQVKDGVLTGYLEENAYMRYAKEAPMPDGKTLLSAYKKAQEKYISYGITVVQEGMMVKEIIPLYQMLFNQNILKLQIIGYPQIQAREAIKTAFPNSIKAYHKNFKIGGYKIFLDGSPQGRTAWMLEPYKGEESYYGYGTMETPQVEEAVTIATEDGMQLLAHCNGDGAAKQYLEALQAGIKKGQKVADIRPVMIHAQLLQVEQMPMVKACGVIPSFFVAHVYHWGEVHVENFGLDRANKISPAKSALDRGILFTFHQDAPVIEPNMLETIWCAVNRITKKGRVLGEQEKIPVYEALKAVTINAAYQYFEEAHRGSIKVGKVADFVILDKNPLTIDPMKIRDIQILETIKEGKSIYKKKGTFLL